MAGKLGDPRTWSYLDREQPVIAPSFSIGEFVPLPHSRRSDAENILASGFNLATFCIFVTKTEKI
jgi:hypothetical protein